MGKAGKVLHHSFVHDGHSEWLSRGLALGLNAEVPFLALTVGLHGNPLGFHGFYGLPGLAPVGCRELGFVFLAFLGAEDERAASAILGAAVAYDLLLFIADFERSLQHFAFAGRRLEGYPAVGSRHQIAAFGEDAEKRLHGFRVAPEVAAQGAQGHVLRVVAGFFRMVIDRKDA